MSVQTKGRRGGWRPGAGRKPLRDELRRSKRVMVTLTKAEHAEALEAAGEEALGTYMRRVLLRHLARRRRK